VKVIDFCDYCGNKLSVPTVIKQNDSAMCHSCFAKPSKKRVMKIYSEDNLEGWR